MRKYLLSLLLAFGCDDGSESAARPPDAQPPLDAVGVDAAPPPPVDAAPADAAPSGPDASLLPDLGTARRIEGLDEPAACEVFRTYHLERVNEIQRGGNVQDCDPGRLSPEASNEVRRRVNFYRAFYNLPLAAAPDPEFIDLAQSCALMLALSGQISREPPENWQCYSNEGAVGAALSNLYYGAENPGKAIDLFVWAESEPDLMAGRRWMLDPGMEGLGYGFFDTRAGGVGGVETGMCQIVRRTEARPGPVLMDPLPYPPPGAFPAAFLSTTRFGRETRTTPWSVSWQDADFSEASVQVFDRFDGGPIRLAADGALTPLPDGPGLPTARFRPALISAIGDKWQVRLHDVKVRGEPVPTVVYDVDFVDCTAQSPID